MTHPLIHALFWLIVCVQFVLTASSDLHEPEVKEDVEDEADKHNVTHALLSSIRRKL